MDAEGEEVRKPGIEELWEKEIRKQGNQELRNLGKRKIKACYRVSLTGPS